MALLNLFRNVGYTEGTETVTRKLPIKEATITFSNGDTKTVQYTHREENGFWMVFKMAVDSDGYVSLTQGASITIYTEDVLTVSNASVKYIEDETLEETKTFEQNVEYKKLDKFTYKPVED